MYHRVLLATVHAVKKWSQYVLDQKFIIRTNQKALKYLMEEQKIVTNSQLMGLTKLMPFDYTIEYKGVENKVVDALSRITGSEFMSLIMSPSSSDLLQRITSSWSDVDMKNIVELLKVGILVSLSSLGTIINLEEKVDCWWEKCQT